MTSVLQSGSNQPQHQARRRLGTARAVAIIMSLPISTTYKLIASGRMPGVVRIGKLVRVDLDVLEAWIASGGEEQPGRSEARNDHG